MGLLIDEGDWLEDGRLLACAYPKSEKALAQLAQRGIATLINLHEKPHDPAQLRQHNLAEIHIPVRDFTPLTPAQLRQGVEAIRNALANGRAVAVHCGGGLGRTGTLLACYLVAGGMDAQAAIDHIRAIRPGSVETAEQEKAVVAYAENRLQP